MKKLLVALLIAFASLAPSATHPLMKSVFPLYILATNPNGAKVWWNLCTVESINPDQHLFLGAAHCVLAGDTDQLGGQTYVGSNHYPVNVLRADREKDLALLWSEQPAVGLVLRTRPIGWKEEVQLPSFQLGWSMFMLTTGRVTNPDGTIEGDTKAFLWHSIYGCGGSSGGPILDKNGALVSVEQVGVRNFEPCSPPMNTR